jgi:hypothetical protein
MSATPEISHEIEKQHGDFRIQTKWNSDFATICEYLGCPTDPCLQISRTKVKKTRFIVWIIQDILLLC